MDWHRAMEEERAEMQRIVALLFSLADLAALVSRRSDPVRGFVLWILRHALVAAYRIVFDVAKAPASLFPPGNTSADALKLARTFRRLARALDRQVGIVFADFDGAELPPIFDFKPWRGRDTGLNLPGSIVAATPAGVMSGRFHLHDTS